jgi:hypothetical protein
MKKLQGVSLIELVIFIILLGIIAQVLIPLTYTLKFTYLLDRETRALEIAQKRMELILTARRIQGFASFVDPCTVGSPPAVCTVPAGYNVVTPTIANDWNGNTNFKVITVQVTGSGEATLRTLVGND